MKEQLDITIKIHAQALDWYKSAENKAQIIITILSSFTVFSTGIILANPDSLHKTILVFDYRIYASLTLAALSMLYGVYNAFLCLHSRLKLNISPVNSDLGTYPYEEMYFFGYHVGHNADLLFNSLKGLIEEKQIKVYSYQIIALSKNVLKKHQCVNRGFWGVTLFVMSLLITVAFYLNNI